MEAPVLEFEQTGVTTLKGVLAEREVVDCKAELQRLSGLQDGDCDRGWSFADGVTKTPAFWS